MLTSVRSTTCLLILAASVAFAQTPSFTVVNTTALEATFGNAGKGVLDPQVSGFTGVAFGNGLFVAPGAGVLENVFRWATSPDGTNWTGRSQPMPAGTTIGGASKVHFINGKFIVFVGQSNSAFGETHCYTSTDGLTWADTGKLSSSAVNVVEFDGSPSLYVAAATNGAQFTSPDLVTWTSHPVPATGIFSHNDVAQLNGKFVSTINGFGGTGYASSDGVTWTQIAALNGAGGPFIEAGNGFFIGTYGGSQFKSTDGVTFTKITPTAPSTWLPPGGSPRYTSAGFIATAVSLEAASLGKTGYMVSADCVKWTPLAFIPDNLKPTTGFFSRAFGFSDIAYGNGKYVMAGSDVQQAAFSILRLPAIAVIAADAVPVPPTITTQPVAQTISTGGTAVFTAVATGASSYQWKLNGANITGATSATLVIRNAGAANAGSYTVDITGSGGTATSAAATLTLSASTNFGRISNLSVLTNITATEPSFTVATVIGGGTGTKAVVVRAAGPSLGALGVPGTISDPQLKIFNGASVQIGASDNWAGDPALQAAMASVGAFPYTGPTSKDAAVADAGVVAGSYSVAVSGVGGATGAVLAEIYDASSNLTATSTRLTNVSVLKAIPTNGNVTLGFTIAGATAKTVLIRAIGPGLAAVGVTAGTLADPTLTLFNSASVAIASNDNWGNDAQITAAGTSVGAFDVKTSTKDAMLLVTLPAGAYTAQAAGVGGTGGLAIVEVYEVP